MGCGTFIFGCIQCSQLSIVCAGTALQSYITFCGITGFSGLLLIFLVSFITFNSLPLGVVVSQCLLLFQTTFFLHILKVDGSATTTSESVVAVVGCSGCSLSHLDKRLSPLVVSP